MAVYCISYDLKSDNYESLIEAIRAYGCWWHQSQSTWFIESSQETKEILENLNSHLDSGDKIIVIQVNPIYFPLIRNLIPFSLIVSI